MSNDWIEYRDVLYESGQMTEEEYQLAIKQDPYDKDDTKYLNNEELLEFNSKSKKEQAEMLFYHNRHSIHGKYCYELVEDIKDKIAKSIIQNFT